MPDVIFVIQIYDHAARPLSFEVVSFRKSGRTRSGDGHRSPWMLKR